MDENIFFEKCVLKLCRTAMIKPRQIERSGFFLLDHNGQTQIYRLVLGQSDFWLWRNRDFPTEDDNFEADKVLWFFSTEPKWTNLSLETGLRSPPRIIRVSENTSNSYALHCLPV